MDKRDTGGRSWPHSLETLDEVFRDSALKDAFGRFRVSEPSLLFDTRFRYSDLTDLNIISHSEGGGSSEHLPNESAVRMTVGMDAGDRKVFQSRRYIRYQPGRSLMALITAVFGERVPGVVKRWGYYDDENGIFFEQTGDGAYIVLRSSVTGEVVDQRIPQEEWNIDPFDGAGKSLIHLDDEKGQILAIDLEWLSLGRVRVGFIVNGNIHYAHAFRHANRVDSAYMATANLPVRWEILNPEGSDSGGEMKAICCAVMSETGFEEERYFAYGASRGNSFREISTTETPILSIRPKLLYKELTNRTEIVPLSFRAMSTGNTVVRLRWDTTLTNANFQEVDSESAVESDIAATAFSGGVAAKTLYVPEGIGAAVESDADIIESRFPLTLDINGENPTIMTITAQAFTGTPNATASIHWREIF